MSDKKIDGKKAKRVVQEKVKGGVNSIVTQIVIAVIIVTFIGSAGSIALGFKDFWADLRKEKIKNEDGTYSIPTEAQTAENNSNNTYIGRVMNEMIRFGESNDFTRALNYLRQESQYNVYQKYMYARSEFDRAINKIIAINNAKHMNIRISRERLVEEIGKREFADSNGEVDTYEMKNNLHDVAKFVRPVTKEIIYETFMREYFEGMPVLESSVTRKYRLEKTIANIKFVNIPNDTVSDSELELFVSVNKNEYIFYKLSDAIFTDKEQAQNALNEINNGGDYNVIVENYKLAGSVIDILYQPFTLAGTFEQEEMNAALSGITEIGKVLAEPVETRLGFHLVRIDEVREGTISDADVKERAQAKYLESNIELIVQKCNETAQNFYTNAVSSGFEAASASSGLSLESFEMTFLQESPFFITNTDVDDAAFVAKIFKSSNGDILEPFVHDNGVVVIKVASINPPEEEEIEYAYPDLLKTAITDQRYALEDDYFFEERKRHEIIDNFIYVITPDFFQTGR